MKTIIAATDFSNSARNAVYYAAHLAASVSAKLVLYHAIETETAVVTESTMMNVGEYYADDALISLEKLKNELIAYTDHSIAVDARLRWGNAAVEMNQLCYEEKPFVVVMAATKKNSFDRFFTGSRTVAISRQCEAPLLLVPENTVFTNIATIAIATDFKEVVGSLPLQQLTHWLKNFTARIEIVNIAPAKGLRGEEVAEAVAVETHFKEMVPKFRYLTNDDALAGLQQYVKQHQPSLLILVPKKHGWFHKSLCKKMVLQPPTPLLIMPNDLHNCNYE